MNATDVIGYTFEADTWCEVCTEDRFPGSTDYLAVGFDPSDYTDSEGNEVHPIFAADEWWDVGQHACENLVCTHCGTYIDEVHRDECQEAYGPEPCDLVLS